MGMRPDNKENREWMSSLYLGGGAAASVLLPQLLAAQNFFLEKLAPLAGTIAPLCGGNCPACGGICLSGAGAALFLGSCKFFYKNLKNKDEEAWK